MACQLAVIVTRIGNRTPSLAKHNANRTFTSIFVYLYIYMRTSALVIWIYGKTERRINKTAMPDECNFDSVTYGLKLKQGTLFERST